MTRLWSAAGVAVYVFALSTAVLPEQEPGFAFGFLVSPAVAAEAGNAEAAAAAPVEPTATGGEVVTPSATAPAWHPDRDGMLTAESSAPSPFDVLNPA